MNYFELFNIPLSLKIDQSLLFKKFLELQKKFHPDFHTNTTAEEQQQALEVSSMSNKALKIFQSPDETLKYVLQLKGLLEEEEKYQLSSDFLMEMMELNEMQIDNKQEANQRIQQLLSEIYKPVVTIIENYQDDKVDEASLLQLKEYYYKKKYLTRLLT